MPIEFNTPDAFKTSMRTMLAQATTSDAQLESLRQFVATDTVSIHTVNQSTLSEPDKAVAVLLMLLRESPNDARLSRVSANLVDFFDKLIELRKANYQKLLHTDALGADPFQGWQPLKVQALGIAGLTLVDSADNKRFVKLAAAQDGAIDVTQAKTWSPEGLGKALGQLRSASDAPQNALMKSYRAKLDQLEGGILGKTQKALEDVLAAKLETQIAGSRAIVDAVLNAPPLAYQVPQASIDVIGNALAATLAKGDDAKPPAARNVQEFKNQVATFLTQMSEAESQALDTALNQVSALGSVAVTAEIATSGGLTPRMVGLFTLFRAIDACVDHPSVHEVMRNDSTPNVAAQQLLKAGLLDQALTSLLAQLNDPDPLGRHRGRELHTGTGPGDNTITVTDVVAIESESGVTGYKVATQNRGAWIFDATGLKREGEPNAAKLADYSIDALRTMTAALLAASPLTVAGPLAYFRRSEEQAKGGFALAGLLENLSAVLSEKLVEQMTATHAVFDALRPLKLAGDAA